MEAFFFALEVLSGLMITFVIFNNLIGGIANFIVYQQENDFRAFVKPWEVALYGLCAHVLTDRRNPRSSEIAEIKRQIKLLRGNSSNEAKVECRRLEGELKEIREYAAKIVFEERRLDDLAKYELSRKDIANDRKLREERTRQISMEDADALAARREAYELE